MPRSKSKRRRYQPPPRKKHKPSPRWYGVLLLTLFGLGVAVIVLNYIGLMPFTGGTAKNWPLFTGLGLIALAFLGSTQWH